MKKSTHWVALALAPVLWLVAGAALAQADWPAKPVTVVVPSSAAGGTDTFGRILAQALTEQLKQRFVVENRPCSTAPPAAAARCIWACA